MTVYVNEDRFYCYGCGEHGDVLDLVRLAEGCELWESMMILAERYGVELLQRPPSWFRKQQRQRPVRDAVAQVRYEHLRRRLYRAFFAPAVAAIQDEEERLREAEIFYGATDQLARMVLAGRRG